MEREIKVFGDTAKAIKEGEKFIAKIGSVEGHKVVTLVPFVEEDNRSHYTLSRENSRNA